MKLIDRAAKALGYSLAAQVASPWSNGDHLTRITLDDLYGIAEGLHIDRDRAMKIATVAKARRVICGQIGRLPMVTYKGTRRAPMQPSLLAQPEREHTRSNTLTWTADDLMFNGVAWWIVQERDAYGWPTFAKRLPIGEATRDSDGKLTHAWGAPVVERDVIQFESIDGGVLHDARETIQRAIAINIAAAYAEANPVPSIDLHNTGEDKTEEQIRKLIDGWKDGRKKGGVGYSSKAMEVRTLGQHPEQLLISGRRAIQAELARHMGIPAWAADIEIEGSSMTFTNRASRNGELIDIALSPYLTAISDRLSLGDVTPRGWVTRFELDELTREDMKTRFETYRIGLGTESKVGADGTTTGGQPGFITVDQIKEWEGWADAS